MTATPSLPANVAGFTPISITYSANATHILYARAHRSNAQTKYNAKGKGKEVAFPEGRTLFLVNVPPDATEREITLLFKQSGTVERVVFDGDEDVEQMLEQEQELEDSGDEGLDAEEEMEDDDSDAGGHPRKKRKIAKDKARPAAPPVIPLPPCTTRILRRTGRTAHIIFLDASSLSRALTAPSKPKSWPVDAAAPYGLAHYTALYTALRPPLDVVKDHADSWILSYEHAQAAKKQESKYHKGEATVDEDGFTLVVRGGAYGQSVGGGVGVASKQFQESGSAGKRHRKKKEAKEKEAFYSFQIHEKKRKELMDLKKRWEEDRAKVEKLKESRKFRPY